MNNSRVTIKTRTVLPYNVTVRAIITKRYHLKSPLKPIDRLPRSHFGASGPSADRRGAHARFNLLCPKDRNISRKDNGGIISRQLAGPLVLSPALCERGV